MTPTDNSAPPGGQRFPVDGHLPDHRCPDDTADAAGTGAGNSARTATVDIVVPVYNEERSLPGCIAGLTSFLETVPWRTSVTVADNASTDATLPTARALAVADERLKVVHLEEKGRGRALKKVWLASTADVVVYMDVDLSTDLHALVPLIAPLVADHSDVAIGTRLARQSTVTRGPRREFISRTYNRLLRTVMAVGFSDAQCGFKAMRSDAAQAILPHVEDDNWFFDTEMLILAERAGYRIHEVPVDWVDDPDSRVDVLATAREDLRGMWRVGTALMTGKTDVDAMSRPPRTAAGPVHGNPDHHSPGHDSPGHDSPGHGEPATRVDGDQRLGGQLLRFVVIGVLSTLAYALLYPLFRMFMWAQLANFLALLVTAMVNTDLNRMFTFGVTTRNGLDRDRAGGLLVFLLCWAVTSGSLAVLQASVPDASAGTELLILTAANLVGTVLRFILFRAMFSGRRRGRR